MSDVTSSAKGGNSVEGGAVEEAGAAVEAQMTCDGAESIDDDAVTPCGCGLACGVRVDGGWVRCVWLSCVGQASCVVGTWGMEASSN